MTKRLIITTLILITVTLLLCGCFNSPYAEQVIATDAKPTELTRKLYVSGAVKNDGYVTVPQLCDYKTVLQTVGITEYSVMPSNLSSAIAANVDRLIVGFTIDGVVYNSVDVNGAFVTLRAQIDGVEDSVVNKLADYIQANGLITNRDKLKSALGDDYLDNYYKFYIDINDYA